MRPKVLGLIAGLSTIGLVDTIYLSYKRLTEDPLLCNVFDGCNIVTTSEYAELFGLIPLAYLGVALYVFLLIMAFLVALKDNVWFKRILTWTIALAFLGSVYFFYVQVIVIKALCVYCLVSLLINALLFITVFINKFTE